MIYASTKWMYLPTSLQGQRITYNFVVFLFAKQSQSYHYV